MNLQKYARVTTDLLAVIAIGEVVPELQAKNLAGGRITREEVVTAATEEVRAMVGRFKLSELDIIRMDANNYQRTHSGLGGGDAMGQRRAILSLTTAAIPAKIDYLLEGEGLDLGVDHIPTPRALETLRLAAKIEALRFVGARKDTGKCTMRWATHPFPGCLVTGNMVGVIDEHVSHVPEMAEELRYVLHHTVTEHMQVGNRYDLVNALRKCSEKWGYTYELYYDAGNGETRKVSIDNGIITDTRGKQ